MTGRSAAVEEAVTALASRLAQASSPADTWQQEGRRTVAALVHGLAQLQGARAVGAAVYAISNRMLGEHPAQLLFWGSQTATLQRLLDSGTFWQWLRWASGLPLPSLREARWLSPLLTALPHWLGPVLLQAESAHAQLERILLPTSPVRVALLAATWLLWSAQRGHPAPDPPRTALGQCLQRLPQALADVEQLGRGARRLLGTPVPDELALRLRDADQTLARARHAWLDRQDCHPERVAAVARMERRRSEADRALADALHVGADQRLTSLAALSMQAVDKRNRLTSLLDHYTHQAGCHNDSVRCDPAPQAAIGAGEQHQLLPALAAAPLVLATPRARLRQVGIIAGATTGTTLLVAGAWWLNERAYRSYVEQAADRMDAGLATATGDEVEGATLYVALANRVAHLVAPSASVDVPAVARALDFPAPDGSSSLRGALREAAALGPEVSDAFVDDAATVLLKRHRRTVVSPTQRPLPGLHALADSTWRVHSQLEQAALDDHRLILDLLWRAWEDLGGGRTVQLSGYHLQPHPHSPLHLDLREVQRCMSLLYQEQDFLDRIYVERTPPRSLYVEDGQLSGRRITSDVRVPLFPLEENTESVAWSPRTVALLERLLAAVEQAGGYFHNGHPPRLDIALGYYLASPSGPAPEALLVRATLSMRIQQLARASRARAGQTGTPAHERRNLLNLRAALRSHVPGDTLQPGVRLRPDPLSDIGYELSLGANVLSQLSNHPTFRRLCVAVNADPDQVTFPASGDVQASRLLSSESVTLFPATAPPAGLEVLASMLRSVAQAIYAPVRSDGRLPLQSLLTWYELPALGAGGAQQVGACVDALDARLATMAGAAGEDLIAAPAAPHHDYQRLVERLWDVHDTYPEDLEGALAGERFEPQPDPPSPLQVAWWEAQDALTEVFEHPEIWLRMRQADAAFRQLRVDATGISALARDGVRRLRILDGMHEISDAALRTLLEAFSQRSDRFGEIEQSPLVPLPAALRFYDLALPPPWDAPAPGGVHARMLPLISQVHARWAEAQPPMSPLDRDAAAIEQILTQLEADVPQQSRFRPSLDTVPDTLLGMALQDFDTILSSLSVRSLVAAQRLVPKHVRVDHSGSLHLHGDGQHLVIQDVAWQWPAETAIHEAMRRLQDIAVYLGGEVHSDGRLRLDDAIALQGGCNALAPVSTTASIECIQQLLGELRSGMRGGYVRAQDLMDAAERDVLRAATAAFVDRQVPAGRSLLEHLAQPLIDAGGFAWSDVHRSAYLLSEMARTPAAIALQRALLTALDWYGRDGAATSPTLLTTLTLEAVMADLGPASNREARIVLGYRLHKVSNWGRTYHQVRADLEDYVRSLGRVSPAAAPMACLWLMQEYLPELLIPDLPPELVYASSVAAVNFVSGVHAAERIKRGLSQRMRFVDLVTLSADLTTRDGVPQMVKVIAIDARRLPTLDWFVFRQNNDPYTSASTSLPSPEEAMLAFDARVEQIQNAITALVAPLPYRMPMVEAAMRQVFPTFPGALAPFPWNTEEIRLCSNKYSGRNFALHEIYAAGELHPSGSEWRICPFHVPMDSSGPVHGERLGAWRDAFEQIRPGFSLLPDIQQQHRLAVDAYFDNARRGYAVLIEEALMLRPQEERAAILRGDVEIFTLRTHEPDLEAQQETRDDTDPYRGRFGVIYRLQINGQARYFQLFPLQSRIIPLPLEQPLRLGGQLEDRSVRLRSGSYVKIKVRRGRPLPVDWRAYVSDVPPREGQVSPVIVERLVSYTPSDAPRTSPFHWLISPVTRDFFWLDKETFYVESLGPNGIEEERRDPLWRKAVDLVVPFVENLRKIQTKDRHEFAVAAFGLYLETILIVGPIASGLVRAIFRPAAAATLPRFSAISRVLVTGTLDALNPTAGTWALLRVGKDVVSRGTDRGVRFTWSLLDRSTSAARAITFGWTMREGMAVLDAGRTLPLALADTRTRVVNGVSNIMVIGTSTAEGSTLNLLDPATHLPYGPTLRERASSAGGGAVSMLVKAGGAVNPPRAPSGRLLQPVRTGMRTGGEAENESGRTTLDPNRGLSVRLPEAP
ncbi:hypothetical protein [Stenotrophomonas sp. PS02289]|uniref:hypothetical protein n=1 Tax=Stenotrophomonas sp. PS02289 TaxID=2991422 RepID=UPI00249B0038|nr:hypothetical protein [Stenotrophomonas sp. PS02289]